MHQFLKIMCENLESPKEKIDGSEDHEITMLRFGRERFKPKEVTYIMTGSTIPDINNICHKSRRRRYR